MPTQLSLFPNKRGDDPYRLTEEKKRAFEMARVVGFDIETSNDLGRIHDDMVREFFKREKFGVSFLTQMVYLGLWCDAVPFGVVLDEDEIRNEATMEWVRSLFAKESITFVAHNAVFDLRLLAGRYNIPVPKKIWDTYSNEIIFGDADPTPVFGSEEKKFNLLDLLKWYDAPAVARRDVLMTATLMAVEWDPSLKQDGAVVAVLEDTSDREDFKTRSAAYFAVHKKLKAFRASIEDLPKSVACAYTALDCMMTVLLMRQQIKRMKGLEQEYPHVFQIVDFENRFNRLCASMGSVGIPVNQRYLLEKIKEWEQMMQAASRRMYEFCVEQIIRRIIKENYGGQDWAEVFEHVELATTDELIHDLQQDASYIWMSATQAGDQYVNALKYLKTNGFTPTKPYDQQIYLFLACDIKLPTPNASNTFLWTGTGKASTGKAAMQWYIERYGDLLADFIEYRANGKRIEKAQELLIHSHLDSRVHSIIVTRTVTGRTSSSDPNLQNMRMREEWGTDEEGEDILLDANFTGVMTALPGYVLLGVDISNAETYMGAMMAKDNRQMEALYTEDYHAQMTKSYFPTLAEEALRHKEAGNEGFWKALRNSSKAVTFGTAYGMGALKLARNPAMHEAVKPREGQVEELKQERDTIRWFIKQGILPESVLRLQNEGGIRAKNEWRTNEQPQEYYYEGGELQEVFNPDTATPEDWEFAVKVWNAQKILQEKDRAFPATTTAKEMAEKFAARYGFVEMWTGRRVFVREARKGWNAICQGGVAELTKRWAVFLHEFLEENTWLDAHVVNYVHDELVIHCPIPFAEYITKMAIHLMDKVVETQPLDKSGVHWFDRTTPRGGFYAGVEHKENSHKWGKFVYREYPFERKLKWDWTDMFEVQELRQQCLNPEYRYKAFCERRFYAPRIAGAGMGEEGLTLKAYVEYLEYQARVARNWEAREELVKLESVAKALQEELGLAPDGLAGALTYDSNNH